MRRSVLALSAIVGVGLTGLGHGRPLPPAGQTAQETSAGNVVEAEAGLRLSPTIRREDDERERLRRAVRLGQTGTYIAEILHARDSALARWRDRNGKPLKVWIQPLSRIDDWHARYVYEVHNAFVAWDTLQLPIRFQIVADSATAHIHVTWIDRFREPISGRTRWTRDADYWITDASIILAVHHRTGEVLEDDAMHAMALHEVGHLLGLDHTSDPSSVMAPKVRVRSLSDADRETARLLYSLPAGSLASRR